MDSIRLPPTASGAPPPYSLVTRVYSKSLRPVVIIGALITSIYTLLSLISAFQNVSITQSENFKTLATVALVLGIFYAIAFVVGILNLFGACAERLPIVRIASPLAVLAALAVIASAFTRTVVHFTQKDNIIAECADESTGQPIISGFGIWGSPANGQTLSNQTAQEWCSNGWSGDTSNEILNLIITMVIGALLAVIALSYYRQVRLSLGLTTAIRRAEFPSHYEPPFSSPPPSVDFTVPRPAKSYAPPPGTPPHDSYDDVLGYDGKPPGYGSVQGEEMALHMKKNPFDDSDAGPARISHDEI